jgi:hypothetical protein
VTVALPTATEGFLAAVERIGGGQVAAVYAVGSLALDDFSERQSNIDLVVVADPALDARQRSQLARALGPLRHAGRAAQLWCATWEDLDAGGPGTGSSSPSLPASPSSPSVPSSPSSPSPLATPMTRAILRHDPMALMGPDWPVVAFDAEVLKAWCTQRLHELVASRHGSMVLRRRITPLVLECARLAHGAISGRVLSKSEAGEAIIQVVSSRYRRVLTDTVGYRRGAQTSMYWGPFERRSHALDLIRDLDRTASGAGQ